MINKDNNPWLGLSSYQTSDSSRFFGREREMEEIGNSIKDNYCTILYGVSGAGKTSIINAGLCPKLSSEGYLPITIRLDHNGRVYSDQIISACFSKFEQTKTELEYPFNADNIRDLDARDALWIFFHASTFWSIDNRKVVPVLFIDQFEELFTLAGTEEQKLSFFRQIDSLFSSVPSERLISYLEASNSSFDFSETPQFRMVFSMREDFLARLEDYCYDLPILRKNRIGLRKMNGLQALDVIMKPQPGLVTEDVALKILSAVTGKSFSGNIIQFQTVAVDTSILSLFCSELFNLSADKAEDIISTTTVEAEGRDILKRFYEKNISVLSKRGRRYLEQHLLTSSGFRNQLAVEDINRTLIKESDIQALESSRIIRKEIINGTERIEFTHDILCKAAMESTRKTKERNNQLSSIITYSAFALLCIYITSALWGFIVNLFFFLWHRDPGMMLSIFNVDSILWITKNLSVILLGLIYLPLCKPTDRKKNIFVDICLISFGIIIAISASRFTIRLNGSQRLEFAGWVVLLSIIPILNLCSKLPMISFKDYCQSVFKFSVGRKDKWTSIILYSSILWGVYRILKGLRYTFLMLDYSKIVISIACILASIITVFLFSFVLSVIIEKYLKHCNKKNLFSISIAQVILVFIYLISQYSHYRWISYISIIALLGISLFALRGFIKAFWERRQYLALVCSIAAISLTYFSANYVSNINILALRDNARDFEHKGCWSQAKIVSQDGYFGIMEGSNIIVPPRFVHIHEDEYDHYYMHDNRNIMHNIRNIGRASTAIARLTNKNFNSYNVRDAKGETYTWHILEHPEIDNKYSRMIPTIAKSNPSDKYVTELAVNYYYQKSIIEGRNEYLNDYYLASERLFLLKCNTDSDAVENALASFYLSKKKQKSNNYFLEHLLDRNLTDSKVLGCIPESPAVIYDALRDLIKTKAIKSEILLNNISRLIDQYDDSEFVISKAKSKSILSLIKKEYVNAIQYAKISSDDVVLAEASLLSDADNLAITYSISSLLRRTNINGQFLGEIVVEDIKYLAEDRSLLDFDILIDYVSLPQEYTESISLDLSHVRRTLSNGKVLYMESGKIISEYQKIVFPSNNDSDLLAVYFKNGKRGFIDRLGHEVTDAKFDHAWLFSENNRLAVVEVDGKIGFINITGNYTLPPSIPMPNELRYYKDWIFDADGNLVFPGKDRKFGLLGEDGMWKTHPIYGEIGDYTYGFRVFGDRESATYGLLNRNGRIVIPQNYTLINVLEDAIEVRDVDYGFRYYTHDGNKITGEVHDWEL